MSNFNNMKVKRITIDQIPPVSTMTKTIKTKLQSVLRNCLFLLSFSFPQVKRSATCGY
ncbi:MAG: hypothetical protein LBQ64_03565 [Bacteroidales bacterium]|nr:hypothetical protein [Bacteroidales bacterium]